MAGVIVFVQVVHYPLFAQVGERGFADYGRAHAVRTGWVVIPPMITELGTAIWLVVTPPTEALRGLALVGAVLLAVVWLSTATLQAPAHGKLASGFDRDVHERLVLSNWIRVAAWGLRLPVAAALAMAH